MKLKVTLQDISLDTGLSITTVSRALRGDTRISPENEKLILESAQRLGYPIIQRKTPIELKNEIYIALIIEINQGEFYSALLDGFKYFEQFSNVRLLVFNTFGMNKSTTEVIAELKRNHFSAAILFLPNHEHTEYKQILKNAPQDFPVVSIVPITNPIIDTISFDSYGGGYMAAEHFYNRGYKELGIIKGAAKAIDSRFRTNGFINFIDTHDELELVWSYQGDYSADSGLKAYQAFKEAKTKPRAIFAANDEMAHSFIVAANEDRYEFPKDIAIVGFDDLLMSRYNYPTLTTIQTDFTLLAETAIGHIMGELAKPTKHVGYTNLIPVKLITRQSS